MVASVAGVYNSLPPEQRAKTAILAGNYGEAGAIDFFGPRYGLPKSISAHLNIAYRCTRGRSVSIARAGLPVDQTGVLGKRVHSRRRGRRVEEARMKIARPMVSRGGA